MKITFYGVRGSCPAPGPSTVKYGGNTSCVHLELRNGGSLIFDSGTGIRLLGQSLAEGTDPLLVLLSHRHWDHIQGFPFFLPIYQAERHIKISSGGDARQDLEAVLAQMDGASFPVNATELPSVLDTISDAAVEKHLSKWDAHIALQKLNHPGGGRAFRVEHDGTSFAFVTDNELHPPGDVATSYDDWVEFCRGVDVLVHDAQYTVDDMPGKHGWGHSLVSEVRKLAVDAEVHSLVMTHHDPIRTDSELDAIQEANEAFFEENRAPARSVCAWEGMEIDVQACASKPGSRTLEIHG